MIPFRDNIPSRSFPLITISLILVNVFVFFYELSLGPGLEPFIGQYGVTPALVFAWPRSDAPFLAVALPFLTSMFLHGGWLHLIGNMWYLWIFGDNVEDRLGHMTYLIFYLLSGLGAGIVHTVFNPDTVVPSVGASGAIAGVLGGYLVSYPFAKVLTLVPIFMFLQVVEIPAMIVLGLWFVMQFFYGTASLAATGAANAGGVAWWAHVGGFVIGMVLIGLFPRKDRQRYDYNS
ncbi:MAG: rhomboid family intramembrane serine protease [Acidobacteria bacterium]|nr:MAG: rhomboid family intramembrane serine protease [Acidobacteriota bacterium]